MKKDNTLLWVGIGSVLVVGTILFFVFRGRGKGKGTTTTTTGDGGADAGIDPSTLVPTGSKIDPAKFKIDFDKIGKILATPKTKQQKYATINIIKKADAQEEKNRFSKTIASLQQKQRDEEFERQFGVKPLKFGTYMGNPALGGSGLKL
jgi:hypothetical protein